MTPKFRHGQLVKPLPEFAEEIGVCRIIKDGERSKKNKKGDTIHETFSYIVMDGSDKRHYFLEDELQ